MLTIDRPLCLVATKQPLSLDSSFAERIAANYMIMGANFSPEDLMLLIGAAPEEAQAEQPMFTSIQVDASHRVSQQVLVDITSNLVNRILLEQNPSFSYQDNVFITSVLNRLGITNVQQFMQEVRRLRQDNLSLYSLYNLYSSRMDELSVLYGAQQESVARSADVAVEYTTDGAEQRYTLHSEIFKRLDTRNVYEDMRQWSRDETMHSTWISRREMHLSEQTRLAFDLALYENRSAVSNWQAVLMQHQQNVYELPLDDTGETAKPGAAVAQQAAAGLLDIVNNLVSTRIERVGRQQGYLANLDAALPGSAINSNYRYNIFHNDPHYYYAYARFGEPSDVSALHREEALVLESYIRSIEEPGQAFMPIAPRGALAQQEAEHLVLLRPGEAEMPEVGRQVHDPAVTPLPATSERELFRKVEETERQSTETFRSLQETLRRETEGQAAAGNGAPEFEPVQMQPPPEPSGSEAFQEDVGRQEAELLRQLEEINRRNIETYRRLEAVKPAVPPQATRITADRRSTMQDAMDILQGRTPRIFEQVRDLPSEPLVPPPRDAVMEEILQNADGQTRTIYETLLRYQREPENVMAEGLMTHITPETFNTEAAGTALVQPPQRQEVRQVNTTETISREVVEREVIENVSRQVKAQTAEEITEIVNKTLAREMDNISGKVYSKMEKKLRSERARRGQ